MECLEGLHVGEGEVVQRVEVIGNTSRPESADQIRGVAKHNVPVIYASTSPESRSADRPGDLKKKSISGVK